jgi:hypothetical protein
MTKHDNVKIFFDLPKDWHAESTETVWAEPTDKNTLIIKNTPFYVKGISYLDEVTFSLKDGVFVFKGVDKKSGHSTYRILQPNKGNIEKFAAYWKPIQDLGASYESKIDQNALYAVDIPPESDINEIYKLLEKGEKEGVWSFEEGDYGRGEK